MIRLGEAMYRKYLEILADATGPEVPLRLWDERAGHEHWLRPTGPARSSRVPVSCERCGATGEVGLRTGSSGLHLTFEVDGPPIELRNGDTLVITHDGLGAIKEVAVDPAPGPEGTWRDRPPLL